jgi:four helix bundle protein
MDQLRFSSNPSHSDNALLRLTFSLAKNVVEYCNLLDSKQKWAISKQLIRSGTSVGANSREAQNAESKKDFIHKLKIALKKAEETEYWLMLCNSLDDYPEPKELLNEINVVIRLLTKIIGTARTKA